MIANQITQTYLDDVADAVMADDFDTYQSRVCLPFYLITHTSTVVIDTEAKLRRAFDDFRETLRSQRVTQYIRLVESAAQLDHDLISARYVSHLMSGGNRILDPFRSEITLRLEGNLWRAASITNSLANSRWPLTVLRSAEDIPLKGPEHD